MCIHELKQIGRVNFTHSLGRSIDPSVSRFPSKPFHGNSADQFGIDFYGPSVNYRGLMSILKASPVSYTKS